MCTDVACLWDGSTYTFIMRLLLTAHLPKASRALNGQSEKYLLYIALPKTT